MPTALATVTEETKRGQTTGSGQSVLPTGLATAATT